MKYFSLLYIFLILTLAANAQFAPAAGEEGSTAIHKDSSIFVGWASNCTIERGYVKLSDTTFTYEDSNRAQNGTPEKATGIADGSVVSLGDRGQAIVTFDEPIVNGEGFDFAVFENGLYALEPPQQYFLELAFVEVSSDGKNYIRFPATSNTPPSPQKGPFDQLDPTNIHNLAGKYEVNYGTPFDLEDLTDSTGIDLNNITHIKLIDVVGYVHDNYASYDALGNPINDPYPTPFATGGFDLDAVGVIHFMGDQTSIPSLLSHSMITIYPNPAEERIHLYGIDQCQVIIYNSTGDIMQTITNYSKNQPITIQQYTKGLYFMRIIENNKQYTKRFLKK